MDSDTVAKSDMSLGSRSFLHRVNDQVQKRQKQSSKDATKDSDKQFVIWRMFMSSTLRASVFMVKNYSDNWHSIKNTEDLTMKQMFDISEKLISCLTEDLVFSVFLWCVWATHGLSTLWALVHCGCPCRDPPVCPPMPRQDGIGDRAPTLCVVGCECLVKSSCVEVVDLCVDIGG